MKKFLVLALALVLILALSLTLLFSCFGSKSIDECAETVISMMFDLIDSEEYEKIVESTGHKKILDEIKELEDREPTGVYEVEIPESVIEEELDLDGVSEDFKTKVIGGLYSSIPSRVVMISGTSAYSFASSYAVNTSFVSNDVKEPLMLIYTFDESYSIIVVAKPGEDGTALVSGYFLICDSLFEDADEIEEFFEEIGIDRVNVEKR